MELWEQDFRVPLAHGFRHCLGENGGPGAVFHTMRSLELVMPIARDVERLCPRALLLNFTNPEARVLHAMLHLTRVRAAGICHGVFGAIGWIAAALGRPAEDLEIVSAGMNHFYAILQVIERRTGCNRLAELVERAARDGSLKSPPLFRKMAEVFGVLTFPSDDHIGEYVAWGVEYSGVKWHYGQECRRVPREDEPPRRDLEDYAAGRRPVDAALLRPSGEVTVPIIADIELDRGSVRPAVNVLNTEGCIENLPRDAAVEVPARVDAGGLHPLKVGPVPEAFAAMMRTQFTIHSILTEAWRTRSRRLLLQALLLDPCVTGIGAAERMLDEMLSLQADFLPTFE
jgi:alpha-galactosidase